MTQNIIRCTRNKLHSVLGTTGYRTAGRFSNVERGCLEAYNTNF